VFEFEQLSYEEGERRRRRYEPLTESVRQLIDATVRTEADDATLATVKGEIDAALAKLRHDQREGTFGISATPDGRTFSWSNVVIGLRNPMAPPLVVEHDTPDKAHLDVHLGAAYEGPPGHLHGGYSALVLDHILGVTASRNDHRTAAATGTITLRYRRPTRLGQLHAEAQIQRTEGRKVYAIGHIADAEGITVEAEGLFIVVKQPG
jgi:acyl-coenzyme A thioesterase PaaI-like protein